MTASSPPPPTAPAPPTAPFENPPTADPDELLELFVGWVEGKGIELYDAQEEAILELFSGSHVVLNTPTGSGKSLVAVAAHLAALARGERSVYTSPIKALVSEKFFDLCDLFGAEQVGMMTGDGAVNPGARIVCCTAEILASMALREGAELPVRCVVMDEFHYYSDPSRGRAWQVPLMLLPDCQFLLMSATLGDPEVTAERLDSTTDRPAVVVRSEQRPVPLEFSWAITPLLTTLEELVQRDRAPVYLVNFSQREATELAQSLISANLADKERRQAVRQELGGFRFDTPYGKKLRRILEHGVGVHHAGLLPKYRRLVERLAQQGLLVIISGTDTLGVGVNVPIRTVLFTRLYKYDGDKSRILSVRDFKQIAGRAGRRGFDDRGFVVAQAPAHSIENSRREAKAAAGGGNKKKFKRESAPKGYVAYDQETFESLQQGTPAALEPVFDVDHGMLLEILQREPGRCGRDGGWAVVLDVIERSHLRDAEKERLVLQAEQLLEGLIEAGVVVDLSGRFLDGPLKLSGHLQDDFSVFHSLALFVMHAVELLDPQADDYPLRILAIVEAIQENPRPILNAQRNAARGEAVAAMKAEGMDYVERMEALEDVDYPKPDADWLYDTFNEYLAERPWLASLHLRPKGVVREMFQTWASFSQFVAELRLDAVEGVLLRYLGQVYKVLVQTVPETAWTDEFVEMTAFLRATIAHADSSLLAEWEQLRSPPQLVDEAAPPPPPPDISKNKRAFRARVRAECHQLVAALSRGGWDGAAACLVDGDWDAAALERAVSPLIEQFGPIRFDHQARLADRTVLREVGDHLWEVSQHLLDGEGEVMGTVDATIDLTGDRAPDGPLLRMQAVG